MSVRPSIFLYAKNTQNSGKPAASASVYFNGQRPAIVTSGAGRHGWLAQTHQIAIRQRRCVCVWVCVHAFARVYAHACACVSPFVRACERASERACVRDVCAIYGNRAIERE